MKQQSISIITAQQKFKDWRDSKLPGEKIPKELWNIVRQILFNPKHKITAVTHGLGISTEQLRQKFPEYFSTRKKTTKPLGSPLHHQFVQAPLTALTSVMSATSNITLEHKNGTKLTLVMPTIEQFTSLIKLFTE